MRNIIQAKCKEIKMTVKTIAYFNIGALIGGIPFFLFWPSIFMSIWMSINLFSLFAIGYGLLLDKIFSVG